MFRPIEDNKKKESRNYLVVGCTKNFYRHSPLIHPDNKWASLDEMPMNGGWAMWDEKVKSGEKTTDYIFTVGKDDPEKLPKPNGGYKVIFLEYVPWDIYYKYNVPKPHNEPYRIIGWNERTQHFCQKCLADDGILIINNHRPSLIVSVKSSAPLPPIKLIC